MGFYDRFVLPWVLHVACAAPAIGVQRKKVVPLATGIILEVGMGTGLNLRYYRSDATHKVYGLEPSAAMRYRAERTAKHTNLDIEIIDGIAEAIPLPDKSIDTIVLTFTLCTIPDPVLALQEMARVLAPEGRILFCEHGVSPESNIAVVQKRLNPFWKRIAGGCNLHRDIPQLLEQAGFQITERFESYIPGTPKFAGYNYWGEAIKLKTTTANTHNPTTS